MPTDNQKLYEIAVGLIPGVGNLITKQLVGFCGSAEDIFKMSKSKLLKIPNVGEVVAQQILDANVIDLAEKELLKAEKEGVEILFFTNPNYPQRLKRFADAPALLYHKGTENLNHGRTIGIVGTRNATEYGKEMTDQICKDLVQYNPQIISGLAYGIDIAAHKSALKYGLKTIGVMASGIDIIYPAVHKSTAIEMQKNGAIITENKFGTIPDAPRFPARNRIIAGISDLLVVVEAAEKGGALITAEIANDYGIDVYAVPGKVNDKFSGGCNKLIAQSKASIFTSVSELVEFLGWNLKGEKKAKKQIIEPTLEGDEKIVYNLLVQNASLQIDDLAWQSQINLNKLSSVILNLEFAGIIKLLPGKKYAIK